MPQSSPRDGATSCLRMGQRVSIVISRSVILALDMTPLQKGY
jgi:hypothetical protein